MEGKELWSKKCPKCGHSAIQHKLGKPDETGVEFMNKYTGKSSQLRYCDHPVPAGVKGYFAFCLCEINDWDYHRSGNYAMIRVTPKIQASQSSDLQYSKA